MKKYQYNKPENGYPEWNNNPGYYSTLGSHFQVYYIGTFSYRNSFFLLSKTQS